MKISSDGLDLEGLKVSKVRFFRVLAKILSIQICFLTLTQSANVFFVLLAKTTCSQNLVLELWSKNLQTNKNGGFLIPQYLRKNLGYEVEFLDMIKGPRKH